MIRSFRKILVPVDFSEYSFRAIQSTWELAKETGAELHLIHIVVPHHIFVPLLLTQDVERARERAREASMVEQAEEEFARIKKDQLDNSSKVTASVVVGSPVGKILEYADQRDINLIVVASHGRTGVERMLIGSVAEKLVRSAKCPVLVLRGRF